MLPSARPRHHLSRCSGNLRLSYRPSSLAMEMVGTGIYAKLTLSSCMIEACRRQASRRPRRSLAVQAQGPSH